MTNELMTHYLKTWPDIFEEVWNDDKTHEWRRDDRGFKLGDRIVLEEFEPVGERYLGRTIDGTITSISTGPEWGIPKGYAVFSLRVTGKKRKGSNVTKDERNERSERDGGIGSIGRAD